VLELRRLNTYVISAIKGPSQSASGSVRKWSYRASAVNGVLFKSFFLNAQGTMCAVSSCIQ
jgi:hypothetical protein